MAIKPLESPFTFSVVTSNLTTQPSLTMDGTTGKESNPLCLNHSIYQKAILRAYLNSHLL